MWKEEKVPKFIAVMCMVGLAAILLYGRFHAGLPGWALRAGAYMRLTGRSFRRAPHFRANPQMEGVMHYDTPGDETDAEMEEAVGRIRELARRVLAGILMFLVCAALILKPTLPVLGGSIFILLLSLLFMRWDGVRGFLGRLRRGGVEYTIGR